jgi:hypothetical protein
MEQIDPFEQIPHLLAKAKIGTSGKISARRWLIMQCFFHRGSEGGLQLS